MRMMMKNLKWRKFLDIACIASAEANRPRREFLIKWKGYPTYDATWEPEPHLESAPEILQDYKDNQPDLKS